MDVLPVCYSQYVYWDNAKTRRSKIIWYRCSDNAGWFPGPHVFSSEVYDTIHWYNPGAGEDELGHREYYNGVPPARFSGERFCGEEEWFLGAPSDAPPLEVDADGIPLCCGVEEPYSPGRSVSGSVSPSQPIPPSGPVCGLCTGGVSPATFRVTMTGWTGSQAFRNGAWDLDYVGGCIWQFFWGVGDGMSISHSASVGWVLSVQATYFFVPPSQSGIDCFTTTTWALLSGPSPPAPHNVSVGPGP